MRFIAFCSVVLLAFAAVGFAGQNTSNSFPPGLNVPNSSQDPGTQQSMMMPMPLLAPLFIEDEKRASVITIVSDSPSSPLDVDIILLNPSGATLAKRTVRISAHGEKTVALADLLAALPISWPVYGSISLTPHRRSTFAAQLSIVGRGGAAADDIEEEFAMLMDERPTNYRAVTSLESPSIAVRSLSEHSETLTIDCLRTNERQAAKNDTISIAPHQLLLLRACSDAGTAPVPDLAGTEVHGPPGRNIRPVALSISSPAPASKLLVFGVGSLVRGSRSGLSGVPFTDLNDLNSSTQIFIGAPTLATTISGGALTLKPTLANFGSATRTATLLLSSNGDQRILQTFTLPPRSVSPTEAIGLPGNVDGSLVVQGDGAPGEVLGNIQAEPASRTSTLSVALPWKDAKQGPNGGQHPWRIDGAFRSTLMLYNPDAQQSNSVDLSVYAKSKEWTKNISLAPLSTVLVSINDIIVGQQLDDKGRTLPRDAVQGLRYVVYAFITQNLRISGPERCGKRPHAAICLCFNLCCLLCS